MNLAKRIPGGLAVLGATLLVSLLGSLFWSSPAHASDRVVAVFYFENQTNDKDFDVLKKGFADMMITDLAEVEGIKLVERARLQDLLDEIELQKSPYFDKETAVKLGKGLNANYAVVGSFQSIKPRVRINARMVEVDTGKVVVGRKVIGKPEEIFDLEQELVKELVVGIKKTYTPSFRPRTKVPDVDTLVEYSRGIDLADQGLYDDAEKALAKVISKAPSFAMARTKRDEFIKRMAAARKVRTDIRAGRTVDMAQATEDFLKKFPLASLNQDEAKIYLGYRVLRGRFLVRALLKELTPGSPRLVRPARKKQAVRLIKAYYANFELLIQEFDLYAKRYARTQGSYYIDTSFELPDEMEKAASEAGIVGRFSNEGADPRLSLAKFLLLGEVNDIDGQRHRIGPTPADLEPKKFKKLGFQLLERAWRDADKHRDTTWWEGHAIDVLEIHADALFLREEREKGIAKLQEVLDRYPTSHSFQHTERRIQQELGLKHDHNIATRERYYKGLQSCKDMDLRVGWGGVITHRARVMGMLAAPFTVAEMEKHCLGKPRLNSLWPYIYTRAALFGARHDDCVMFDKYIAKSLDNGGSKSDAAGYRKNYSKCPKP